MSHDPDERADLARALAAHRSGTPWSRAQESRWRWRVRRLAEASGQTPEALEAELAAAAEHLQPEPVTPTIDDLLEGIAREHLDIPTLATRHADGDDFHEVAVWGLRKALRAAYEAGQRSRGQ